ncbi:response regulator [Geothermobacter hydrogeniphilus]|uniref:Response regulatory domain-containing protein n=1 Tax=Geothermobacter hydrogeniphilus TaxID=1969733 RepID=A0A1X0Y354_9BACT|nr:response regulator [Geothermobacter hydrogeniphilus]ORJ59590.1 hypothetical protein B5V00_09920 [Geothermobacter hydrogeniphilus]
MIIQCPNCSARYRIDASKINREVARVKCPKCQSGFEVRLRARQSADQKSGTHGSCGRRSKVVVVDDARFFREVVLDILQPLDIEIFKAGDGAEALEVIRREVPDLVILDLKLPRMDGYQLIRAIRSDPAIRNTRLLAMSSVFRGEEEARKVTLAGADDFLNKSFRPEHLLQRVNRLLDS